MRMLAVSILVSMLFSNLLLSKGFGYNDMVQFCKNKKSPITGRQFNGKRASKNIMGLVAGKYIYPRHGALLLFRDNYYIIQLPSNRNGIHGTDGDDLLARGGIVGGCSKEQLSEAIHRNGLDVKSFKLVKRY